MNADFLDHNDVDLTDRHVEADDEVCDKIGQNCAANQLLGILITGICFLKRKELRVTELCIAIALVDSSTLLVISKRAVSQRE